MEYPTKLIENAVGEIAKLPGIGKKTALRLAMHLLRKPEQDSADLAMAITELRSKTTYCTECKHIAEAALCSICANERRDRQLLCIVENSRDLMAIESTGQYRGIFHVLGGVISPMDGIGPDDLQMESLFQRIAKLEPREIILALSATMEGDTTSFYIQKKTQSGTMKMTSLARGIPVGGELEFADELTLVRSLQQRTTF